MPCMISSQSVAGGVILLVSKLKSKLVCGISISIHHHHHHVRLLEVVKRNQHRAVAQYTSLIVDYYIYNAE